LHVAPGGHDVLQLPSVQFTAQVPGPQYVTQSPWVQFMVQSPDVGHRSLQLPSMQVMVHGADEHVV